MQLVRLMMSGIRICLSASHDAQVSLMVHPDKCSHPNAKEAFEMLNSANTALLSEERRREIIHVLNMAKGVCSSYLV